jgi:nitrogenase molybdenum-iron protein alpha/beta subunit
MNIPLIRIWELADLLEKDGQKRIPPKNDKLGIEIYKNPKVDDVVTVLIPGIIHRPSIGINNPDDFFKELQKEIQQLLPKIKKLVFQDGGLTPIPDWFTDWCDQNKIEIKWVKDEIQKINDRKFKESLSPDTRETFGDIIDEL